MKDHKKKILLVEDEALIALSQAQTLKKNGYNVLLSSNGAHALKMVRENEDIDLLLIDIDLGSDIDGTELAGLILKERNLPIIFLSNYTGEEIIEKTGKINSYGYVVKNSGETVLLTSVKMAFRLNDAHKEVQRQKIEIEAAYEELQIVIKKLQKANSEFEVANTELKKSEETLLKSESALKESEERYRRITESITDYIYSVRIRNGIPIETVHGSACVAITGYTATEFIDDPYLWYNMVNSEDREIINKQVFDLLNNHISYPVEHRIVRKDGSQRWIRNTPVPHHDENGNLISYDGLIQDITERKKAEIELRNSEEKYRNIFENALEGIFQTTLDGKYISINPAFAKMFGFSSTQEMISSITNIGKQLYVNPEDRSRFTQELTENGFINNYDVEVYRKDKKKFWISINAKTVKNEEGDVLYIEGTNINITERKKMEELISTQRNLGISLSSTSNIYEALSYVINACLNVEGIDCGGIYLLNRETGALDLTIQRGLSKRFIEKVFSFSSSSKQTEISMIGKTSVFNNIQKNSSMDPLFFEEKILSMISIPLKYENTLQAVLNLASHTTDEITPDIQIHLESLTAHVGDTIARVNTEKALLESERLYRLLTENATDMISRHAADATILYVTPSCERLLGYKPEEMIGKHASFIMSKEDDERVWKSIKAALKNNQDSYRIEHKMKKKDGVMIWVETLGHLIIGSEGLLLEIHCVVRDIEDRKKSEEEKLSLEKQVQQTQKLESLGILAGGIAHDFNNMLMAILGNADLALLHLKEEEKVKPLLSEIIKVSQRAAELSQQMLAYSGKGRFIVKPISITDIIDDMRHLLEISVSKKAALKFDLDKNIPSTEADVTQIRQVIMNLVINSSEAIGDNAGEITINTRFIDCDKEYLKKNNLISEITPGKYIILEVIDNGCGMNNETLSKIFDPFFTTKFTGRGLGLAAVVGIIRGHKGAVKVISESGKGTIFRIFFPSVGKDPEKITDQIKIKENWKGSGTVLLVDDEEAIRLVCRRILEYIGFNVIEASNGKKALDIFIENGNIIKCILLDLTMPEMDGEEVFKYIRRIDQKIPIVISSGYNEQEVSERFESKEGTGFIQKPYKVSNLVKVIRDLVEKK